MLLSSRLFLSTYSRRFASSSFTSEPGFGGSIRKLFVFDQIRPDVFSTSQLTSVAQGSPKRAYGGLIFAQALAAAERTVPDTHYPHALHSFFIRNVDTAAPIEYHVRRSRDGASFFTRCVEAIQKDKIAFTFQVSFQKEEPHSIQHSDPMPTGIKHWSKIPPAKEMLPEMVVAVEKAGGQIPKNWKQWMENYLVSKILFDCRIVNPLVIAKKNSPSHCYYWFRTTGDLPNCPKVNRYLMAYISDALMGVSILRPHFVNHFNASMIFSLDHSIWFHEIRPRADEWFLMEVQIPVAGYSRGFSYARIFSEDGRHLMSAAQDVLIRSKGEASRL